MRLIFSPSARNEMQRINEKISGDVRRAAREHAEEVHKLSKVLADAPQMKLVVVPRRRSDGRFIASRH